MKELNRTELAAIKRVNKIVAPYKKKLNKLNSKIAELQAEIETTTNSIREWEEPVRQMTGGFTSDEVLDGSWNYPIDIIEEPIEIDIEQL